MLDLNTEFGSRVARRLREEQIIWLTTVRADLTPQARPVWFYWDGETFLIYSQPDQPKVRDIEQNPKVALNFNSDKRGDDVMIFTGEARIDAGAPPAGLMAEYVAKYEEGLKYIQMTPDSFARAYSVAIRVTPTKLRGH